ncbi:MAG: phosphoglucosamine mutase [Elusimicrobia bacterium]|jgi:phosphoglucosamine mutase|nr:phosphoglucosamine mutase [Elusimicrobiota bacterium]
MKKLFGTDGIRGVANKPPMTTETALRIGQALTYILKRKDHRPRIIIGKDTRLSGYMLESSLAAGICSMGGDVVLVGPMPTPGISFITSNMDADAGVVISASHNPYQDNGIKIFTNSGQKLNNMQEEEIENLIFEGKLQSLLPEAKKIGRAFREDDALGRYIVFLRHTLPKHINLEGMKIVLDCANGATYKVAPMLFKEMRADIVTLNTSPNGKNINREAGSLHPDLLSKKIIEEKADIGLAFDGDGDRLIAVDEKGNIVTGDTLIAIFARYMKETGTLENDSAVTTVMSNIGLKKSFEKLGIKRIEAPVGDRFVLEKMQEFNSVLGGEDSGHIIFSKHHTTGDGIITALQLLYVIKETGEKLSELSKVIKVYPQVLKNLEVKKKVPLDKLKTTGKAIKEAENYLGDEGRVLVRYSGTQNLLRIMAEGPTNKKTKHAVEIILKAAKKEMG